MNFPTRPPNPVAVTFPGQVFDVELLEAALTVHRDTEEVEALRNLLGTDAWETLDVTDAEIAGPCTLTAGLVQARKSVHRDQVVVVAGHSFGEITALAYAGALTLPNALEIVAERGRLSRNAARTLPGRMVAVMGMDETEVDWFRRLAIADSGGVCEVAAVNDTRQIVLSGNTTAIEKFAELVSRTDAIINDLPIPGAYHSPLMGEASRSFQQFVERYMFSNIEVDLVSYIDAKAHRTALNFPTLIAQGLVMPVRWNRVVDAINLLGVTEALDPGPGQVLRRLARRGQKLNYWDTNEVAVAS